MSKKKWKKKKKSSPQSRNRTWVQNRLFESEWRLSRLTVIRLTRNSSLINPGVDFIHYIVSNVILMLDRQLMKMMAETIL